MIMSHLYPKLIAYTKQGIINGCEHSFKKRLRDFYLICTNSQCFIDFTSFHFCVKYSSNQKFSKNNFL